MSDITHLTNAVTFLTDREQEDYVKLRDEIRALVDTPYLAFIDEMAALNPILHLARGHKGAEKLAKLFAVTDEAMGVEAEDVSSNGKPKRDPRHHKSYMTPYMREARARQTRAVQAKWLLPEHIKRRYPRGLSGSVRKGLVDHLKIFWQAGKMQAVVSRPAGEDRNAAGKRYWQEIDLLLDRALEGDRAAAKKVLGDYVLPDPTTPH